MMHLNYQPSLESINLQVWNEATKVCIQGLPLILGIRKNHNSAEECFGFCHRLIATLSEASASIDFYIYQSIFYVNKLQIS